MRTKLISARCIISGSPEFDRHHWKSKRSGGPDESWNLMPLARIYHVECHKLGATTFANKYPAVKKWLIDNGWVFDEFLKKWKRGIND